MKLRVALVCLVWGEEFADFFARYCLPSLLEPHNIPGLSREHDVTLLLYTDQPTQEFLARCDSFIALSKFAKVECLPLGRLPAAARSNHWIPWQHAVAGRSRDFDFFLVIIPDCIYAAGCLAAICDALEEHDTVYYRLPQVCKETVTVELDGLRRGEGHEYISFTPLQAIELFVRHVNPKHAAAACSGTFFINHLEYAIELSAGSMVVSEPASHPLALRASTRSVSYTFDALSVGAKTCYLDILGVSAEPTIKFVEQYYRWPKLHRGHSRLMNLGSWASSFRDASIDAYCKSATHIALDRGRVLQQHQGQVKRAKTKFVNATLNYLAVAARIYIRARELPDDTAAKYIALIIAAPGFHRRLRPLQSGFTVVLPREESRFEEVVEKIESRPAAKEILRRFLFLHIAAHPLRIVPGFAFFLTYPDAADRLPKAFVIDPHTVALGGGLWGKAVSPPQWVQENVFCIEADIDYSHLTWSMLDTANGTSERVLDAPELSDAADDVDELHVGMTAAHPANGALHRHPHLVMTKVARRAAVTARNVAKFGVVKAHDMAAKLPLIDQSAWIGRNLYRKARGRPWLSKEQAGISSPVARMLEQEARKVYEIARKVYPGFRPTITEREPRPSLLPSESARARYDAISRLNIVSGLARIILAFDERLGLDPRQSLVLTCLSSIRSKLVEEVEARSALPAESPLERFELAWRAFEEGKTREALRLFREVIADEQLIEASAVDPRAREAFVRGAELIGRHEELQGDAETAAETYRQVLMFDGTGIVARRLLLMLWRDGRIREAAELAPRVVKSDRNLAQHLQGSDTVDYLTRWLGREARRNPR